MEVAFNGFFPVIPEETFYVGARLAREAFSGLDGLFAGKPRSYSNAVHLNTLFSHAYLLWRASLLALGCVAAPKI